MQQKVHDLLRKINYLEIDIDIQKQILFSTPSADRTEMERLLKIIARKKEEIEAMRREIQKISPEEFNRITTLEQSIISFKKAASETKFSDMKWMQHGQDCFVSLKNGSRLECLVTARDEIGNWIVITIEGELKHFPSTEVDEII